MKNNYKSKKLIICSTGDASSENERGGSPYFFTEALRKKGFDASGLKLDLKKLELLRIKWAFKRAFSFKHPRGFQYTDLFTDLIDHQWPLINPNHLPIAWHPFILPKKAIQNNNFILYIDATQKQVFENYIKFVKSVSLKSNAIKREKYIMQKSLLIFCMSEWAAKSVINEYGINASKVHILTGGANLKKGILKTCFSQNNEINLISKEKIRLGFIGKDWDRKRGSFVLKVIEKLNADGIRAYLRVIGPTKNELPKSPYLQPLGFFDKKKEFYRFINEIKSWHFSTLFSESEASPRSNLESLMLGVPVLTHDIGGISSTIPDNRCGKVFNSYPTISEVADWIKNQIINYEKYLLWRKELSYRTNEFSWDHAAEKFDEIISKL